MLSTVCPRLGGRTLVLAPCERTGLLLGTERDYASKAASKDLRNRSRCSRLAHLHREVGANGARLSAERLVGNDERGACPQTLRDPGADVLGNLDALERIGGARRGPCSFGGAPTCSSTEAGF